MTKIFNTFKKHCYTPMSGARFFLNKYQALSHTTLYGFRPLFKNLEKTNNTILRKC